MKKYGHSNAYLYVINILKKIHVLFISLFMRRHVKRRKPDNMSSDEISGRRSQTKRKAKNEAAEQNISDFEGIFCAGDECKGQT